MRFAVLMIGVAFCQTVYGQFDVGLGYNLFRPSGEMTTTVPAVHVFSVFGFYQVPRVPLLVGFDMGIGSHGMNMTNIDFTYDDGFTVPARMTVSNNVVQTGLSLRLELLRAHAVRPYIAARGGLMHFATHLSIEDRYGNDPETDNTIYSENLLNDRTWVYSFGGGLRYDLSNAFKSLGENHYFVDIGIHWLEGGAIDHMSVKADERDNAMADLFLHPERPYIELPWYTGSAYRTRMQSFEYRFKLVYRF